MKVRDTVRFRADMAPSKPITRKTTKTATLLAYLEQNPGASAQEIKRDLDKTFTVIAYGLVRSNKVRTKKLDYALRFYKAEPEKPFSLATETPPKPVDIQPDYRRLAQEYAWDHPDYLPVLKEFVTWLEARNAE